MKIFSTWEVETAEGVRGLVSTAAEQLGWSGAPHLEVRAESINDVRLSQPQGHLQGEGNSESHEYQ